MSTFSIARENLAAQIAANTTYSAFAYPQPVPQSMSVQLAPADPYVVSTNNQKSLACKLRLNIELFAPLWDNRGNLEQIETMAATVRNLIVDSTQYIGDLTAPRPISLDTGDLLTASFTIELMTTWS